MDTFHGVNPIDFHDLATSSVTALKYLKSVCNTR